MASQGTNLVPSSQAHSCTMHGFAAAEGGSTSKSAFFTCPHSGCGAAFSSAEALDLHVNGHDFGYLGLQDHGIKDTSAGYGPPPGYRNDLFKDGGTADFYTGYAHPLNAPLGNNTGAVSWNPTYTPAPVDIVANGYTGYADPLGASLGNNAGTTAYVDYGWNPTSFVTPAVYNIVGSGFGSGSGTGSGMPPLQANIGGYRPVGPPAPIDPARVPCTHPNCGRTFGRPSDMARHAKKHETNPLRYPCPVPGCTFIGAKAFLRHDKLLSHGRNAHGMEIWDE